MSIYFWKKLLLAQVFVLLIWGSASAQFEEGIKDPTKIGVDTGNHISTPITITIAGSQGETSKRIQNIIRFKLNEVATGTTGSLTYFKSGFSATVTLRADVWRSAANINNPPDDTTTTTLTITYNPAADSVYTPIAYWVVGNKDTGWEQVRVNISKIVLSGWGNGWDTTSILKLLTVENEMRVLRYFKTPVLTAPATINHTYDAVNHPDQLSVSWALPAGGANSSQLEYAWVENETQGYYFVNGVFSTNKLFQVNSTRVDVDTSGQIFNIPLLYDADPSKGGGTLYYRVRTVQRKNNGSVATGAWSAVQTFAYNGHQPNLNWQSTTSFAENGKTKSVIQYFDGSLRERQTVTKDNSTGNTIVAETIYDLQGRPGIQILPTPTISTAIQYFADFNRFVGQLPNDDPAKYFDLAVAGAQCSGAPKLDTTRGNGQYYSQNNPWINIDSSAKFIPDANGYAFTETRYTDDPTQRISMQGGVGQAHQIGNGHETKYFYGKPTQNELDALFGTEVGDASHYFKNMVQDANGQMSISYLDMHGRVIATALAGAAPGKLTSIASPAFYPTTSGVLTNNLLTPSTNIIKGNSIESVSTILVPVTTVDTFHYQLTPAILNQINCGGTHICFDCKYNLEISINQEGCDTSSPIVKHYNNLQIVTTNQCASSMGFIGDNISTPTYQISFPVTLTTGSWVIRKTLTMNDSMFKVRRDSALVAFLCKTQQTISDSIFTKMSTTTGCNIPPVRQNCTACQAIVGGGYAAYKTNLINAGEAGNLSDTDMHNLYTQDSLACADACGLALNPAFNTLGGIRTLMLADMMPYSGQYALSSDSVGSTSRLEAKYNIFNTSYVDTGHFGQFGGGIKPFYQNPVSATGTPSFYANADGSFDNTIYPNGLSDRALQDTIHSNIFTNIFNRNWANQLLYYHPEYRKLRFAETTMLSSYTWLDKIMQCTTYKMASDSSYITPLIKDPFFTFNSNQGYVLANTDSMQTYLTNHIGNPGSTLKISIWSIANGEALCDTSLPLGDREYCMAHVSATAIDPSATTTAQKDAVWQAFKVTYLGYRNEMVLAYINSQPGDSLTARAMGELQKNGKQLRFATAADVANQNKWSWWSSVVDTSLNTALKNDSVTYAGVTKAYVDSNKVDQCTAQRPFWQAKLMQCEQLQQFLLNGVPADTVKVNNIINAILDSMVMVCHNSIDTSNNPYGASNVNPAKGAVVPSNFENIINHVFAQYLILNPPSNYFCNPYTIDNPKPYNSNPPLFVNNKANIDTCNCKQFAAIKITAKGLNYDTTSFASMNSYLLTTYNDTISAALWQGLLQCSSNAWFTDTCYWRLNAGGGAISAGLIAYWPLNNSGNDISGNGHTGSLSAVSATNDKFSNTNSALLFNSSLASHVTINDASDLRLHNTDFTFTTWARVDVYDSGLNSALLSKRGATGPYKGYLFGVSGVNTRLQGGQGLTAGGYGLYNNGFSSYSWSNAVDHNWHRITATYNATTQKLYKYLDGVLSDSSISVVSPTDSAYYLTIGVDQAAVNSGSNGYYFTGAMSDMRLYNRVISSTEIQSLNTNSATITSIVPQSPSPSMPAGSGDSATVYYILPPGTTSAQLIVDIDDQVITITGTTSKKVALTACGTHSFDIVAHSGTTVTSPMVYLNACYTKDSCKHTYHPIKLSGAVIIPSFLNCGYVKPCITCGAIQAYTTAFHSIYTSYGSVPYTSGASSVDTAKARQNALWARYLNYKTGFNKTANEYAAAYLICSGGSDSLATALCALDKPVTFVTMPDTTHSNPCQQVREQSDFMAQVIVQQQHDSLIANFDSLYTAKCLSAQSTEVFYATYQPSEYHYTLYYYDEAGNLVKTLPPLAVKPNYNATYLAQVQAARVAGTYKINGTNFESMASQYRYNGLNMLIAENSPDGGLKNFWYDRLGRPAVSQNASQAKPILKTRAYSYSLYDSLGRITEVGQIPQDTTINLLTQAICQDTTLLKNWFAAGGVRQQITRTTYDVVYPPFTGAGYIRGLNLRNRVSYVEVIDSSNVTFIAHRAATFYSYDIHGNVDSLLQDYDTASVMGTLMNGNQYKLIKYDYDLVSGKTNQVSYQPGKADAFYHQYQYDAENHLIGVRSSRDSILWQNDASYFYYRHGPLARIQLGDLQVQGVDYAYTLQGWLKSVNPSFKQDTSGLYDADGMTATPLFARDAYKLNLNYFDDGTYTDYMPVRAPTGYIQGNGLPNAKQNDLYNGNISSMAVSIRKLAAVAAQHARYAGPMEYNYRYDQLNRLMSMDAWPTNDSFAPLDSAMYDYAERFGYDPNGNIMTLSRNGTVGNSGALAMDNFTYWYKYTKADGITRGEYTPDNLPAGGYLTNQLSSIRDAITAGNYPNDINNQAAFHYKYDAIGNMISDSLNTITWSVYGKMLTDSNASGIITYTYDANGNRISKKAGAITSWYVYDAKGNVVAVYTKGDNARNGGALTQSEVDIYGSSRLGISNCNLNCTSLAFAPYNTLSRGSRLFELTNHLGNVLATISDKKLQHSHDNSTVDYYSPDVINANDYYAFGSQMPGRTYSASTSVYRYGFNGQEKSTEIEIGENVYSAAFWEYDSRIGRRWNRDPKPNVGMSEYSTFGNNPIFNCDLLGDTIRPGSDWTLLYKKIVAMHNNAMKMVRSQDPNYVGDYGCLNALAINLNSLYNTTIVPDKKNKKENYTSILNQIGKYQGSREKPEPTIFGIAQDDQTDRTSMFNRDEHNNYDYKSGIVANLVNQLKGNKGIFVFGVGPGREYHSLLIVAFTNGQDMKELGDNRISSPQKPLFYMLDDHGGFVYDAAQLESNLVGFVQGAALYYSGRRDPPLRGQPKLNTKKVRINAHIDNLKPPSQ